MIEQLDAEIPRIRALNPDVLIVTGDHSTPSKLQEPQLASGADACSCARRAGPTPSRSSASRTVCAAAWASSRRST